MHSIIEHLYGIYIYTIFLFAQANQPSETLQYHPSLTWSPQAQTWRNFNWRLPCGFYNPWNSIPNELTLKQAETVIIWWNSSIASNCRFAAGRWKQRRRCMPRTKSLNNRDTMMIPQSIPCSASFLIFLIDLRPRQMWLKSLKKVDWILRQTRCVEV